MKKKLIFKLFLFPNKSAGTLNFELQKLNTSHAHLFLNHPEFSILEINPKIPTRELKKLNTLVSQYGELEKYV